MKFIKYIGREYENQCLTGNEEDLATMWQDNLGPICHQKKINKTQKCSE